MEEKHIFINSRYAVEQPISQNLKVSKKKTTNNKGFFVIALAFFSLSFAAICAAIIYLDVNRIIPDTLFSKIFYVVSGFGVIELLFLIISRKSRLIAIISVFLCTAVISVSTYGSYVLHSRQEMTPRICISERLKSPNDSHRLICFILENASRILYSRSTGFMFYPANN